MRKKKKIFIQLNLTARTTLPFIYPVSEVNDHLLPMS
jgi:hypothetical protein